jgi:hypothetical protein
MMAKLGVEDLVQLINNPNEGKEVDTMKLRKNIPDFQTRLRAPQVPTKYGFFIFREEITQLTKGTKKRKAMVERKYKKLNRKSYKNTIWMEKMYERKIKSGEISDPLHKVILPLEIPMGYKIFDHKGNYYATVLDSDDIFYYIVIQKNSSEIHFFLRTKVEELYIQAQCGGPYGFIVPPEFFKEYEKLI